MVFLPLRGSISGRRVQVTAACLIAVAPLFCAGTAQAQDDTRILASTVRQPADRLWFFHDGDYAQRFHTGPHAGGFRMTTVKIPFRSVAGPRPYDIQLRDAVGTAFGTFGPNILATLIKPASLSVGLNTFVVPGDGIELNPATSYYLMLHTNPRGAPSPGFDVTTSDDDDSGVVMYVDQNSLRLRPTNTSWVRWSHTWQVIIEGCLLPGTCRPPAVSQPQPQPQPTSLRVTASCEPCEVPPGGEVRLTAKARSAAGDTLTYAWSAQGGSWRGETDGAVAQWTAPSRTGEVRIQVWVSDGISSVTDTVTVTVGGPEPVPVLPAAGIAVLVFLVLGTARRIHARPN